MTQKEFMAWVDRRLREKDWSRRQLAREMGLSCGTVSRYFTQSRSLSLEQMNRIAKALDTKLSDAVAEIDV